MTEVGTLLLDVLILSAIAIVALIAVLGLYYVRQSRSEKQSKRLEADEHITVRISSKEVKLGRRWLMLLIQIFLFSGVPALLIFKWSVAWEAHDPKRGFWAGVMLTYIGIVVVGGALCWLGLAIGRITNMEGMETCTKYSNASTKQHQWFISSATPLTRGVVDVEKIQNTKLKEFLNKLSQKHDVSTEFKIGNEILYLTLVVNFQHDAEIAILMTTHPYAIAFQRQDGRIYSISIPLMTKVSRTKLIDLGTTTILNPVTAKNEKKWEIRKVPILWCPVDDQDDLDLQARFSAESKGIKAEAVLAAKVAAVDPCAIAIRDELATEKVNADRKVKQGEEREKRLVENVAMQVELAKKKHIRKMPLVRKDYLWFIVGCIVLFLLGLVLGGFIRLPGGGADPGDEKEMLKWLLILAM